MSFEHEKRESLRLLSGLENGNLTAADAYNLAEKRDPVMIHLVMRYLREKYPSTQAAAEGVSRRLIELTSTYDKVVSMSKKGEKDSITEWFTESHSMGEFYDAPEQFIDLIVEKIEG
ncbi:MAG: hypothetical protein NTY08_00825 [Proteobacteria bacterium]|nr:hypothetical protein [Pseudomonadota bacterium]